MKAFFGRDKLVDLLHYLVRSLVVLSSISLLLSQTPEIHESVNPTFRSKVKVVLVDVVVTDRDGHPITGLKQNDFEVYENGERQLIASFEEHRGEPRPPVPTHPALPAHFYTNAPSVLAADSVNVLLLDGLNTHSENQAEVRQQMIGYLKSVDPGPQLAIFTLSTRLQMVEGFNRDPRVLLAALNHKNWGGRPQASMLLRSEAEETGERNMLQATVDEHGNKDAIQALQRFLDEAKATEQGSRTSMTLQALRQLADYLSGFPGRKNLIWFSGSFPSNVVFSTQDLADDRGLGKELKKTTNLLAAAQIAVYPVVAQGLETQPLFEANQLAPNIVAAPSVPIEQRTVQGTNDRLNRDALVRNANSEAAEKIAFDTGGKAFFNTNGLKDALSETIAHRAHYYSLSYSPNDKRTLGRYRHIQVKVEGHYRLAYRRGYFEDDETQPKNDGPEHEGDPLRGLLLHGLPDSTQITFNLRLLRSNPQTPPVAQFAGDNKALRGPVDRFTADFVIPLDSLGFEMTSDGIRHCNVELALVAYDHNGNPLNWLFRSIKASLKPEAYPAAARNGARFHEDIDIPAGENYLRAGIYDMQSEKTGTLEIPLSEVTHLESAATSPDLHVHASLQSSPLPGVTVSPNPTPPEPAAEVLRRPGSSNVAEYCSSLAGNIQNSEVLAKACELVFSLRTKLTDIICDEEMKRNWSQVETQAYGNMAGGPVLVAHADIITAKLAYREGQEYYSDTRVDGQPIGSASPSGGYWSEGEFASILFGIFAPSSKTDFRFKQTARLGSRHTAVFGFHVASENNTSYVLHVGDQRWFPEYRGMLWIDQDTGHIVALQRETLHMSHRPITVARTKIDYADLKLGDGTSLMLPTRSETLICPASWRSPNDLCSRNIISFKNWHKFAARATIVFQPPQ